MIFFANGLFGSPMNWNTILEEIQGKPELSGEVRFELEVGAERSNSVAGWEGEGGEQRVALNKSVHSEAGLDGLGYYSRGDTGQAGAQRGGDGWRWGKWRVRAWQVRQTWGRWCMRVNERGGSEQKVMVGQGSGIMPEVWQQEWMGM